jgi:hypothetical protein
MTFPLTPASPFVDFTTKFTSAIGNAWRTAIAASLDGVAGGTYTPSSALTIGGSGMVVNPFVSANATIASGGTGLTIASGATETIANGATLTVAGGGTISLAAGSFPTNATLQANAGALIQIGANASIGVLTNGAIDVGSGANLLVFGTETIEAGGALQVTGTSVSPGTIEVEQWGLLQLDSGGELNALSNSTVILGGTNTLSGTTSLTGAMTQTSAGTYTQQGVRTKSGASGYDVERITTADPAGAGGTLTIADPRTEDEYQVVSSGLIVLGIPGGAALGTRVRFYIPQGSSLVVDFYSGSTATKIVRMNGSGSGSLGTPLSQQFASVFADFRLVSGPAWQVCASGGFFNSIP